MSKQGLLFSLFIDENNDDSADQVACNAHWSFIAVFINAYVGYTSGDQGVYWLGYSRGDQGEIKGFNGLEVTSEGLMASTV